MSFAYDDGGQRPAPDASRPTPATDGDVLTRRRRPVLARAGTTPVSGRDRLRRLALLLVDAVALGAALLLSGFASFGQRLDSPVLTLVPVSLVLGKLVGLYDRDTSVIDKSTLQELPRVLESLAVGGGLIFLFAPLAGVTVHRVQALEFFVFAAVLITCLRPAARRAILRLCGPERAVIVGSGQVARLLARKLDTHPGYGIEVVGYLDVPWPEHHPDEGGVPLLGDLSRFREICRELQVERVVVAFCTLDHEHLLEAITASNAFGLKLTIVPRLFEVLGRSLVVDEVEGMSLLAVRGISRSRSALLAKRILDIGGAALALLVLMPLLALIAVAIKLTSRGPVLFSQDRIGRGHRPFRMHKFRTMVVGAEGREQELQHLNEVPYPMFKIAHDPRVTRVGRLLRRASLDELPQLWDVLRGEMSLVGPRPLVPREDAQVIGWHRARLDIAPGLTGPWQVLGRTKIPFSEMVKLDYRYVADWSLWNDVKLLLRTAPVVLRRTGL